MGKAESRDYMSWKVVKESSTYSATLSWADDRVSLRATLNCLVYLRLLSPSKILLQVSSQMLRSSKYQVPLYASQDDWKALRICLTLLAAKRTTTPNLKHRSITSKLSNSELVRIFVEKLNRNMRNDSVYKKSLIPQNLQIPKSSLNFTYNEKNR